MTDDAGSTPERYSGTANPAYEARLARLTAEAVAPFFLPHLKPGMRVLDCGCGPGSITLGLANAVAPGGEVVGIDLQESQVEMARRLAQEHGVDNVTFRQASIYELPFPDASFEAVCAVHVLFHLREPLRALKEMRRVLTPGGVIGIRDGDLHARIVEPYLPLVAALSEIDIRVVESSGGDLSFGRKQRGLLTAAGFVNIQASNLTFAAGTAESLAQYAETISLRFAGPAYLDVIVGQGWATHAQLDLMLDALRSWASRPDAFTSETFGTAVGWVPE